MVLQLLAMINLIIFSYLLRAIASYVAKCKLKNSKSNLLLKKVS